MVIRIKKRLYLKPRICPMCGRRCWLCQNWASQHCKKCHKRHIHQKKRQKIRAKYGCRKSSKYLHGYRSRRKRAIKKQPWCSLCGSTANLTTHHVGGGDAHLTVLCDECHQAYERYNTKRKIKQCIRKIGINANIKRLRRIVLGIKVLIWRKQAESECLNIKLRNWRQNDCVCNNN